jgi:glycosyltransferase involved in cell wall biosynthesis
MHDQHPYREPVSPLPLGVIRPLWSVMIPTYNCANYLKETLNSVLMQAPSADVMQIEVVDDCSSEDNLEDLVREVGGDRVSFYRQAHNVGHTKNFQTCLERSRGQIIHLLHGDDCIRAGFYQKMQQLFELYPEIGAAFCRHVHMNEKGNWHYISSLEQSESGILQNWLDRIAVRQRIQTPSMVVRRDVYENLGGFDSRLSWTEDWEMWIRIAANYAVGYETEPLALYRQHSNSSSGRKVRSGETIQSLRQAIDIVHEYLPLEKADQLTQTALKNYADYALNIARESIRVNDWAAAKNQIREALRCQLSMNTLYSSCKLSMKSLFLKSCLTTSSVFNLSK